MTAPAPTSPAGPPAAVPLRAWQRSALVTYLRAAPEDFLAVATPGAGKTTFALRIASELLRSGTVERVVVVAPTEHLKTQWALAAAQAGIALDPAFTPAARHLSPDYTGAAVTYAGVAANPLVYRGMTTARRTLVVLDEVHHAGDSKSWGDAVREAFEPAERRLCLTGTPFRSDTSPIPFVRYERGADGVTRSASDSAYGYADALRDGVVRPVLFLAYSGTATWRTRAGEEVTATLGEPLTAEQTAAAWRTALDPHGDWMPAVLQAADRRLTQKRRDGMTDAGGMVIASDQKTARLYADLLQHITGAAPTVVLSDDPTASRKIAAFTASDERWLVAVRMVSEGVDIPRLAVGVYATSVSTPLFFAQAVGRFVRARRAGETASVFLPSVPSLLALAGEMERQRDHALDGPAREQFLADELVAAANRQQDEPDGEDEGAFTALQASAHLDRVIYDGADYGTGAQVGSEDELDFLGLPGLLEPEQVRTLLAQRQASQISKQVREQVSKQVREQQASPPVVPAAAPSTFELLQGLRKELNGLVGAWHHRTGKPHGVVHTELRTACGGPPSPQATAAQLQDRIETIRRWARDRR
ncbi:MAG: DEAD/DEAH box helicase [Actinomycetota bacterium]|nr:DEAD/DEAH box helicase [Actinomycetota bacterium]